MKKSGDRLREKNSGEDRAKKIPDRDPPAMMPGKNPRIGNRRSWDNS
jgi:hypothetical protein